VSGDPVRDEAERLVAAAIAAISLAARGLGTAGSRRPGSASHGSGFATGSPECCVCPVCRVISAMRDPSPDLAERLASGAGDLATAVAGILRSLSRAGARPNPPERDGDEFWDSLGRRARDEPAPSRPTGPARPGEWVSDVDDPWRTATRTPPPDDVLGSELSDHDLLDQAVLDGDASPPPPGKKMAKKAVKKVAPAPPPPPPTPMAKKAVRKAVQPPAAGSVDDEPLRRTGAVPPAKKAAKKTAKKAAPPPEARG
jgi:hypothetical protein